jgi:hypothetical protein
MILLIKVHILADLYLLSKIELAQNQIINLKTTYYEHSKTMVWIYRGDGHQFWSTRLLRNRNLQSGTANSRQSSNC